MEAPEDTRKAFLATYDEKKQTLDGKWEVNTKSSLECQSAIWKLRSEKRDLETEFAMQTAAKEKEITAKVEDLVETHKNGEKILGEKRASTTRKRFVRVWLVLFCFRN